MKRVSLSRVLVASLLLGGASFVGAVEVSPDDANIQYTGRIDYSDKTAPAMSWAGTSIRIKFTGTSVKAKLKMPGDGKNKQFFYAIVNGDDQNGKVITCKSGEATHVLASGLSEGTHDLLLYKRTDGGPTPVSFLGFELDDGASLKTPDPRPGIRMEVFGDSISTGLGSDRKRGGEHSGEATDNYMSYGSITARNLGAEFHCISKSGIGLMKSWWPTIMPQYYDRLSATSLEGSGEAWDFSKWTPHLVIVNVFQNDSWTRKGTTKKEATEAYVTFLKKIRGHYPKAKIVGVLGSMDASKSQGGKWRQAVEGAVKQMNDAGDKEVFSYMFKKQTGHRHPNRGDHIAMSKELTAFIKTIGEIKPDPPKPVKAAYPAPTAKEKQMREYMVSAQKNYAAGKMTKEKFNAGLKKIAAAVPGTKTADEAKSLMVD